MPGITPATNNFPIESSVIIPQTINKTLGGINIPKQALPAIEPAANFSSYPAFFISGHAILEKAAADAIEVPVTAANAAFPVTVATPSLPGTPFRPLFISEYKSPAAPLRDKKSPIRTKSGIVIKIWSLISSYAAPPT